MSTHRIMKKIKPWSDCKSRFLESNETYSVRPWAVIVLSWKLFWLNTICGNWEATPRSVWPTVTRVTKSDCAFGDTRISKLGNTTFRKCRGLVILSSLGCSHNLLTASSMEYMSLPPFITGSPASPMISPRVSGFDPDGIETPRVVLKSEKLVWVLHSNIQWVGAWMNARITLAPFHSIIERSLETIAGQLIMCLVLWVRDMYLARQKCQATKASWFE